MNPLTVTTHGLSVTLTTNAAGHDFICYRHSTPQQLNAILIEALAKIIALGEADPRGYKE